MTRTAHSTDFGVFSGWRMGQGPIRDRLAAHIRRAIANGALRSGCRLPAERELARALSISRTTVDSVYERLDAERLVVRRGGSGTWVLGPTYLEETGTDSAMASLLGRWHYAGDLESIDVSKALPPDASYLSLPELDRTGLLSGTGDGYEVSGSVPLRRLIAARLAQQGLDTDVDQVLITSGAQQAIALVAAAFVRPGDVVGVEESTYPGALATFAMVNAHVHGIKTDSSGLQAEAAASVIAKGARLLYVVPSHNPGGWIMPEGRRLALRSLAARSDTLIIEDLTLADTWLVQPPPPPIATGASAARIVSIGSFSKIGWGGLRIGYIRADPTLIARLTRYKRALDLATSPLLQRITEMLLVQGDSWMDAWRQELRRRRDVLEEALAAEMPEWRWRTPDTGLAFWVDTGTADADEFASLAQTYGVVVAPGGLATPGRTKSTHLRIAYALEPARLVEAARRLGRAWRSRSGYPMRSYPDLHLT